MTKQEQVLKILELAMQYNDKSDRLRINIDYSGHVELFCVRILDITDLSKEDEYLLFCHRIYEDEGQLQETINKIQEMINAPRRPTHTSRR